VKKKVKKMCVTAALSGLRSVRAVQYAMQCSWLSILQICPCMFPCQDLGPELHSACLEGRLDDVKGLLRRWAPVNFADKVGKGSLK